LKDFFSFCGPITNFSLDQDRNEATIIFQTPDAARSASLLNDATLGDRKITVESLPGYTVPNAGSSEQPVPPSGLEPKSQTSIVQALLAAGYKLADHASQQARIYDEQYQLSNKAQSFVKKFDEKVHNIDNEYKVSENVQYTFDTLGKKIHDVDRQYSIGDHFNQAIAAAVTTGELARDVIVAKTQETSTSINNSTEDIRNQGEAVTLSALSTAAGALEALHLQEKGEALVSSIQNFVQTNPTAHAAWTNFNDWATSLNDYIAGTPDVGKE